MENLPEILLLEWPRELQAEVIQVPLLEASGLLQPILPHQLGIFSKYASII